MRKYTFITCIVFFFSCGTMSAQNSRSLSYGFKVGINAANLYIDDYVEEKIKIGFQGGVFTDIPIGQSKFSITPELLFTSKGNNSVYDHQFFGKGSVKFGLVVENEVSNEKFFFSIKSISID